MAGELDLKNTWTAAKFLNGGKPASPIQLDAVRTRITDEFVEVVIPKVITDGNPAVLTFEWGNGEKVR